MQQSRAVQAIMATILIQTFLFTQSFKYRMVNEPLL